MQGITWQDIVNQVAEIEKEQNPQFVCSTTAKQIFTRLKGIFPIQRSIYFTPHQLTILNGVVYNKGTFPTPQEQEGIYQWYISRLVTQDQVDVIRLSLAPDHHLVYVKDGDAWILLHSWVDQFGLNFWNLVDHKEQVNHLKLNPDTKLESNWKFYSVLICAYMIQRVSSAQELPNGHDRQKLIKALNQTNKYFLEDAQISEIWVLKRK